MIEIFNTSDEKFEPSLGISNEMVFFCICNGVRVLLFLLEGSLNKFLKKRSYFLAERLKTVRGLVSRCSIPKQERFSKAQSNLKSEGHRI